MTNIDLTAAIRPTADAIYRQLSGQYGDFSTPSDDEAEAVLKAALPHILALAESGRTTVNGHHRTYSDRN